MPIRVRIPASLRQLTQGADEVETEGPTVGAVIDALEQRFPGLKDRLCDENGVRRFINIYLNEEDDVRFLGGINAKLADRDTLQIVPAIAGGCSQHA